MDSELQTYAAPRGEPMDVLRLSSPFSSNSDIDACCLRQAPIPVHYSEQDAFQNITNFLKYSYIICISIKNVLL